MDDDDWEQPPSPSPPPPSTSNFGLVIACICIVGLVIGYVGFLITLQIRACNNMCLRVNDAAPTTPGWPAKLGNANTFDLFFSDLV